MPVLLTVQQQMQVPQRLPVMLMERMGVDAMTLWAVQRLPSRVPRPAVVAVASRAQLPMQVH